MVCTLFVVIPCAVIFAITTDRVVYAGNQWNSSIVFETGTPQLIPFDPYSCPKDSNFYSQPFLLYLEVRAPSDTGLILTLHDKNIPNSNKIDSCSINSGGLCRIPVPRLDNVYAFIALDITGSSTEEVKWKCSYYNLPYLLSLIFLSCCACLCFLFCCNTCLCCTKYRCCDLDNTPNARGERVVPRPYSKPQKRYPQHVPRGDGSQTQPLLLGKRIETVVENGIAIRKEITTLQRITDNGKCQIVENVQVIATDGTNAVVAEQTQGLTLN